MTSHMTSQITLEENGSVEWIYHLSDIHIRPTERHKEYQQVFDNLYEYLSSQANLDKGLVVICGDIFHSRDRLVSETILLFDSFIEHLIKIIPTIIIPGNHDTFSHHDRLDIISGIVDIKCQVCSQQNFYYLKETGVYRYKNLNLYVSNFLDKEIVSAEKSERLNIALYHGMLAGAKIHDDFVTKNNISLTDFEGYDLILLGDIHKRQFLADNCAYPGSLIQQSHKEEYNHGLIKWNTSTLTGQFVDIKNNYGFIKVHVSNGKITNEDELSLFKYSKVRFICDTHEELDLENLKRIVSEKTKIVSVTKEIAVSEETQLPLVPLQRTQDKYEYEISLLNSLMSSQNQSVKDQVIEMHAMLSKEIETDTQRTTFPWEIESISFKNMFIYGEDHINTINFKDKMGIIGILQTNAVGKSSILNIILYALFGSIFKSKALTNRNIINKNKNTFFVTMNILLNDTRYVIERNGKNKKRGSSIVIEETLSFKSISPDNIETNLTDTNKATTYETITSVLGLSDREEFLLTNVISNSNYKSILSMTNADLEDTFNKLFNTKIYKEMYNVIHKKVKTMNNVITSKNGELKRTIESYFPSSHSEYIAEKEGLEKKAQELTTKLSIIDQRIDSLSGAAGVQVTDKSESTLKAQLKQLQEATQCPIQCDDVIQIKTNINHFQKIIKEGAEFLNVKIPKDLPSEKLEDLYALQLTLSEKKENLTGIKDLTAVCLHAKQELKKYQKNNLIVEPEVIDSVVGDLNDLEEDEEGLLILEKQTRDKTVDALRKTSSTVMSKVIGYRETIKAKEDNDLKIMKNVEIDEQLSEIRKKIKYLKAHKIQDARAQLHMNKENLDALDNLHQIKEIQDALKELENNKILQQQLEERKILCVEKEKLHKTLLTVTKRIGELSFAISEIAKKDKIQEILQSEIDLLNAELQVYELYRELLSDKKLPKLLLKDTINAVASEANSLVYNLAGLKVVIDDNVEDSNGKWEIYLKKNGIVLGTEQISGYERFIVNIGLKLALDKYKHFSGIKCFFVDESMDCISIENQDKVDDLFDILKKYFHHVIVISHNQDLKSKVDSRIMIETDFTSSKII